MKTVRMWNWPGRCLAVLMLMSGLGSPVAVQAVEGADPKRVVTVTLPPKVDLAKLTDLVGDLVKVSLQYNPQRMRGQTKLALRGNHTAAELWAVYNQVLASNSFTTIISGEPPVYQVVQTGEAAALSLLIDFNKLKAMPFPPGYVTLIHDLQHLSPEAAVQVLTPLMTGQAGQVKQVGKSGPRILFSGLRDKVLEAHALIMRLDQPELKPTFEYYAPRFAAPQKLQSSLTAAWAAAGRVSGRQVTVELQLTPDGRRLLLIAAKDQMTGLLELCKRLDESEPSVSKTYRSSDFAMDEVATLIKEVFGRDGASEKLHVVRDKLTDSLIITATEGQHERIKELLDRLEDAPSGSKAQMRHFPIKHRQAAEMMALLQDLIAFDAESGNAEGGSTTTSVRPDVRPAPRNQQTTNTPQANSTTAGSPAAAGSTANSRQNPQVRSVTVADLQMTVDEATNTLIAAGNSKTLEQVKELIEKIDKRQPQVKLELLIVNLTEEDSLTFGTKLAAVFKDDDILTGVGSNLPADDSAARPDGSEALDAVLSGVGVIKPGTFGAIVEASQVLRDGKAANKVTLILDNNAEGILNSVRQVPFSSQNSSSAGVSTGLGGTSDAGTQVTVTPTIGAGDNLTLTYSVAVSDFTSDPINANGVVLPPTRTNDDLASTATIPDGHAIVVGGIVVEREGDSISQVPILGDIPLLGWLFRSKTKSTNRGYFMVFMRANILRHPTFEDLKYLSVEMAKELEVENDGWPRLEARFID